MIGEDKKFDELLFTDYVRNMFLEVMVDFVPEIMTELSDKIFLLYLKSRVGFALHPLISKKKLNWEDIESGASNLKLPQKRFRKSLIEWQERWHLVERDNEPKWVLRWAVEVLRIWNASPIHRILQLLPDFNKGRRSPTDFYIRESGFPMYYPMKETRKEYLSWVENAAREKLKDDPLLSKTSAQQRELFISGIRDKAEKYCVKVEKLYRSLPRQRPELILHVIWSVRFQVEEQSFSDIANLEGRLPIMQERLKDKKIVSLDQLHEASKDLEGVKPISASTVKRGVENVLRDIGLKARDVQRGYPLGRKRSAKEQNITSVLRGLGS